MLKRLFFISCFFAFSLVIVAQYATQLSDCKRITSCEVDNNHRFRDSTLSGARSYVEFIKCSTNTNVGGSVQTCINNDPLDSCPKRDCEFSCEPNSTNPTGVGYSYTDCRDNVFIRTIVCNSCPTPTPTPTPTPSPKPDNCWGESWQIFIAECEAGGGIWKGCTGCWSPIVVDIEGNGYNLTDGNNGVEFDLIGEGSKDRIAWTSANSDDAWLALDRNNNGVIDSGLELFGTATNQPSSIPTRDRNGFLALAEFDKPQNGGNSDGGIDARDAVFSKLRLWIDTNHNGISEANELHHLPEFDVVAIGLDYRESKRTDEFGNRFRYRAKVWDSKRGSVGRWAWDVFPVRPR